MKVLNLVISNAAPNMKEAMWLKPVDGGFALYAMFNGKWNTLKLVDDGSTSGIGDDKAKTNITITDITKLTSKQCDSLVVGDQIIKSTGKQKHLYTVTYKEDKQGLCLTYFDAENAETVAYEWDKSDKVWEYLDTTITPLGT